MTISPATSAELIVYSPAEICLLSSSNESVAMPRRIVLRIGVETWRFGFASKRMFDAEAAGSEGGKCLGSSRRRATGVARSPEVVTPVGGERLLRIAAGAPEELLGDRSEQVRDRLLEHPRLERERRRPIRR